MECDDPPSTPCPLPKAGEPPLHRAARIGDHAAIRALAAAGANLNAIFDINLDPDAPEIPATPLMIAAGSADGATEATVALLLELGADPAVMLDERSAATYAIDGLRWNDPPGGDSARFRRLVQAGSPLPADPERLNAMVCDAASRGDAERLRALLAHGLNPHGLRGSTDATGVDGRSVQDAESEPDSHADPLACLPEATGSSGSDAIDRSDPEGWAADDSAPSHFTLPLFCAAESGSAECVDMLLAAGVDPKARDCSGRTAIHYAGTHEVLRSLQQVGLGLEDADASEYTPLTCAVCDGPDALPRVRMLLDAGANPNATHDRGYTVFMSAVGSNRYPALLRLLVESGADPHAVSDLGYNAFHAALDVVGDANAEASVRDTLGYLKQLGVNIEHRNAENHTPLALAIERGYGLEVVVLCELGADPNAVCTFCRYGCDAGDPVDLPLLFHAICTIALEKDVKVEALLRSGANPLATDSGGRTPLMHAVTSLCQSTDNADALFNDFLQGLAGLGLQHASMPTTRDAYLARDAPILQAFLDRFAAQLPPTEPDEFAGDSEDGRQRALPVVALLGMHESWARTHGK
ncbi:MAG: ankyrin repeat domain-containing protein, partial [Phycisphaerales bacterium]|nr:ankyrin repeat domain-containing protein [Phycisphaerales bacterium]